jgi:uncharacterized membrane protein
MKKDKNAFLVATTVVLMFTWVSDAVAQSDPAGPPDAQSLFMRNWLGSGQRSKLGPQHAATAPDVGTQTDVESLAPAKAKVYKFATTDYPGAALSVAYDINKGTVIGLFSLPSTPPYSSFTVKGGVFRPLQVPGVTNTEALGSNTVGQIVGDYTDQGGTDHGFLYQSGHFTTVDNPFSSGPTTLYDINDAGVMVGTWMSIGDPRLRGLAGPLGSMKAVDFPGAYHTAVLGVNSGGDVVGYWIAPNAQWPAFHGFRPSKGSLISIDYPGALATVAFDINDNGDIAGWYYTDGGSITHGFIYSGGSFQTLDVPGAVSTVLTRIKNNLQITGDFIDTSGEVHGFYGH